MDVWLLLVGVLVGRGFQPRSLAAMVAALATSWLHMSALARFRRAMLARP
jgi:hypothetical protein